MRELVGLADRREEFARLGVHVFGLAIDEPGDLTELQERLGEAVTLLADPSGQAVSGFDMIDPDPFPDRVQARAGTFWIDRDGRLRFRWLTDSYRERPKPEEILAKIRSGL